MGSEAYLPTKPTKPISPTGMFNSQFDFNKRDHSKKNNFLWFGSKGAIHKGLDIILDVVSKNTNFNLYICGLTPNDQHLLKDLLNKPNIFIMGRVDVQSQEFLDIIYKTPFLTFPSCSEAQSTSILTLLRHGVIPVVIKNSCGIDRFAEHLIFINDGNTVSLEEKMNWLSRQSEEWVKARSSNSFDMSNKQFTLNNFSNTLYTALDEFIESPIG